MNLIHITIISTTVGIYIYVCVSHSVMSDSLWPHGLYSPPSSSVHGILQARILEWVAISFSKGSLQPRDRTQVSHMAGGFFTVWATKEAAFKRNGVALVVNRRVQNAVLGCDLKNDRMILVHFQGKPFNNTVIQVYAPTIDAEEAEVEQLYKDLELTPGSSPMGFSRQEYWSGFQCHPPGDLSNPRIKPRSPALQVDSLPSEPPQKPKNTGVGSLSLLLRVKNC